MSLSGFANNMRRRGRRVETQANRVKREVALIADREVVLETPVDTGRARSNWIVSLNAPVVTPREPYSPGEKLGKGERLNAQAAIQQGTERIVVAAPGQDIYISNNVNYIGRLNEGYSAQAPAGFVQSAVARAVAHVRKARLVDGN